MGDLGQLDSVFGLEAFQGCGLAALFFARHGYIRESDQRLPLHSLQVLCVPRSVLSGLIATELRRHLLRCIGAPDYYENLCAFYLRLRARGYPASFLQTQFERAPSFDRRRHLLFSESTKPTAVSAPFVLALPYSHEVDKLLRGTLRDTAEILPDYLASHRRLIAWCKTPKICDLASVPGKKAFDQRFLTTQPAAAAPGLDVP